MYSIKPRSKHALTDEARMSIASQSRSCSVSPGALSGLVLLFAPICDRLVETQRFRLCDILDKPA